MLICRTWALALSLVIATPTLAEERSARFVEMMGMLPGSVVSNRSAVTPEFFDFEVAARVVAAVASARPGEVRADARRILTGPFAELPEGSDWTATVGFNAGDLRAAALVREPPDSRLALLLAAGVAPRVAPALVANGYTASEDHGLPAFWRGAKDFGMDLGARNPDDPFGFPLPKSSRIALVGDVLLQSASWPGLGSLVAATGPSPTVLALGRALDLPGWGDRALVQGIIFSDPASFNTGIRLDDSLTPETVPPGAVPYWSNLLLADLSDGQSDLTLVVLLYTARSDAETAAQALEAGWGAAVLPSFGDKTLAEAVGTGAATVAGDGPFLAIYAIETAPDVSAPGMLRNRGYHVLLNAAFMRDLPLLGPALP